MHVLLSGLAGLLIGPFVHHIAVQAGADRPFGLGAAVCRWCGEPGSPFRRCASCDRRPWRVVPTTVATGALSALAAWAEGPNWVVVAYVFFAGMTVALFLTDIDHKRIPNRISYPGTVVAVALLGVTAWFDGRWQDFPRALLGGLVYSGVFFVVYLVARGGFGFGDVKLAVSLGAFTAFVGWRMLFVAGLATAAVGGIVALAAVLFARAGRNTEIPYGPPMIIGTWIAIVGGSDLAGMVF